MGKSIKKSKQSAQRKNIALNQVILGEEDTLFGRVVKKLGNSQFLIQTTDTEDRGIEVTAAILSKSMVRIEVGDVILVGRNESSKGITYEILGMIDKKTAVQLKEAKRLHPSLFSEQDDINDDLFDRNEDDKEGEESGKPKIDKGNKPVKKEKNLLNPEEEVDVEAI